MQTGRRGLSLLYLSHANTGYLQLSALCKAQVRCSIPWLHTLQMRNMLYMYKINYTVWIKRHTLSSKIEFCYYEHSSNFFATGIIVTTVLIFFWLDRPSRPRPPHCWGFEITLRHTTLCRTTMDGRSICRRDLYLKTHNTHKGQTSMPPAGIESAIATSEWPQTHALDRAATGIGPEIKKNRFFGRFMYGAKYCLFTNVMFILRCDTQRSLVALRFKILLVMLCDAPTSLTFKNCTFCPHCIYVWLYLSENKQRLVPLTP
jgi:hypothetical protein